MASASTRKELVLRALSQAGRGLEIKTQVEELLNDILRNMALEFRWPELRKFGTKSSFTLNSGEDESALPSDFGSGMDNLKFGPDNIPLDEKDGDEFVHLRGWYNLLEGNRQPRFYMIDQVDSVFRFDRKADQNYTFQPIYYHLPAVIPTGPSGDDLYPWYRDDRTLMEMIVLAIYQFNVDPREGEQFLKVQQMKANIKRGLVAATGGGRTVVLARDKFKPIRLRNRTRLR